MRKLRKTVWGMPGSYRRCIQKSGNLVEQGFDGILCNPRIEAFVHEMNLVLTPNRRIVDERAGSLTGGVFSALFALVHCLVI